MMMTFPPEPVTASRRTVKDRFRLQTVPGRIRALATIAIIAVAGLFAVTLYYLNQADDGVHTIGRGSGQQVIATSNLYYALSDMDAQLAGVLLAGPGGTASPDPAAANAAYMADRSTAFVALDKAEDLARGDDAATSTVQSVQTDLGRYDNLAGQAIALNKASKHPAGPPPAASGIGDLYKQATDLMSQQLLPQAYNLTLDSATTVRRTYEDKRAAMSIGRLWVGLAGLVVLALLAGLQIYLTVGFRRLVSPLLALGTVGVLALCGTAIVVLGSAASDLKTAKTHGFDSVLALSRARAISNNASGDETRFLLLPDRSDIYEANYLDESQSIAYESSAGNLNGYYGDLAADLTKYQSDPSEQVPFLGFFGAEANNITEPSQRQTFTTVFAAYNKVLQNDKQLRQLVSSGRTAAAIKQKVDPGSAATADFTNYNNDMTKLIDSHNKIFGDAIGDAEGSLSGWDWGLPIGAVLLAGLIVAGVQPRLKEFR